MTKFAVLILFSFLLSLSGMTQSTSSMLDVGVLKAASLKDPSREISQIPSFAEIMEHEGPNKSLVFVLISELGTSQSDYVRTKYFNSPQLQEVLKKYDYFFEVERNSIAGRELSRIIGVASYPAFVVKQGGTYSDPKHIEAQDLDELIHKLKEFAKSN